ncbi:hypothetical protein DM872_04280 [Pseudomonas taiwanensis]|uniref:site-specific integrase n=1 Tax=Pseudomonas taiwanensis TaxID=470150 RepID=UPI0015BCABE7|nr:site-specific integrase [Pseudomonas taiwanensis]NWL76062.1 hypothetical protein [Pseudomonas taiwanensis]
MPRKPFSKSALESSERPPLQRKLPENTPQAIQKRSIARGQADVSAQGLIVQNKTRGTKDFVRDFTDLVTEYPHHKLIVQQLLIGAQLHAAKRLITYQSHQDIYYSIQEFVLFLNSAEPINKSVNGVADVDGQVCLNFRSFLIRSYPGRTVNRKRYGAIKNIFLSLKNKYKGQDWVGKEFQWPTGPASNEQVTEGYSREIHNKLIEGCLIDIKFIMKWMESYDHVVKDAKTMLEYDLSLENLMFDLTIKEQTKRSNGSIKATHIKGFEWVIRHTGDVKEYIRENGISIEQFLAIYRTRAHELAVKGRPVVGTEVSERGLVYGCDREESGLIATANVGRLYPDWPMQFTFEAAGHLFSSEWNKNAAHGTNKKYSTLERRLRLALMYMRVGPEHLPYEMGQMAYISRVAFTMGTLFPFFLFVMLQTGWNFEVIVSISDNLEDHIEDDLLDDDYAIIYGFKGRSDKSQMHRSNKRDKFGAYQILHFVAKKVREHSSSPHYLPGTLFQCVISKNLWNMFGRLCTPVTTTNFWPASTEFLRRHGIKLDTDTKSPKIETKRLRTTYETRRREQGLDIDEVSTMMGHSDIDTTVNNYDSDWGSTEILNGRLRKIQSKHEEDFRSYSANLLTDVSLAKLREATLRCGSKEELRSVVAPLVAKLNSSEDSVIQLLSPEGQTFIASCLNSKQPDWPGAENFLSTDTSCNYFNRCPLCSQCVIFKEALPFIARRVSDLDGLRERLNPLEWEKSYRAEYLGWNGVLEGWGNPIELAEAIDQSKHNGYALPLTMIGPS